jgi:hypothetical protein
MLELLEGRWVPSTTVYDAATDFSPIHNPNGAWSYGWSSTLGSTFNIDQVPRHYGGLDDWESALPLRGNVIHNGTDMPQYITERTAVYQPGQLGQHPGIDGEYSLIRWTAPANGSISIASTFSGTDFVGPTTTDVHVLRNGISLFDGIVNGYGPTSSRSFTGNLTITTGDTIDFAVGDGPDGNYYYDNTGIAATISYAARASLVGRDAATGQWWVGLSNSSGFTNGLAGAWDPSATWVDVHTGDFTGHGFSDVIGRDLHTGAWWVGVSDGQGHFTTTLWDVWSPAARWVDVQVGDFNGDGKLDIAGRVQEDGSWWVGLSTGSGFVTSRWGDWSPTVSWEDVRVGGLTGTGKADLIGRMPGGQWWAALSSGTTFTNTLWTTWPPDAPGLTWADVQLADVNGDGKADLVGRWLQTGQWWVTLSAGPAAGSTSLWTTWALSVTWVDVHVVDVTGDGRADLLGRDLASGNWWVGTSTGTAFTNRLWASWSPAVVWADVQVADFNGDGRLDIAGREPNGSWWVGLSDGTSFLTSRWGGWYLGIAWADVHCGVLG